MSQIFHLVLATYRSIFTYVFQNYFADIGAIIRFRQCQWNNPAIYGSMNHLIPLKLIIQPNKEKSQTKLYAYFMGCTSTIPLLLRHNERDSVSNHQRLYCLLNRLFRRRSKKTSKLRVTCHCAGNSPVTGEFPAQRAIMLSCVPTPSSPRHLPQFQCFYDDRFYNEKQWLTRAVPRDTAMPNEDLRDTGNGCDQNP